MNLIHGRDVTAEQIELIVGREFPIHRFVSMCNAIVWALSRSGGISQVSFSERVFVSDRGVDAEWSFDLTKTVTDSPILIAPGRTVFQYKQRDCTGRDRNKIISDLKSDLSGAAAKVASRTGKPLDNYTLFTNVSLSIDEKKSLQDAVVAGSANVRCEIFGAAEIAATLNGLPYLRSAYFSTSEFATWDRAWQLHENQCLVDTAPALVGSCEVVRAAIDDSSANVILVAGPPGMGKTRLCLEATKHRPIDSIFALDGRSVTLSDLLALHLPAEPLVVVVDDPEYDKIEELIASSVGEGLKLLLTVPTLNAASLFNYGQDPRVKVIPVNPLSESESGELLRASGAKLDYSTESWVVQQAGGNPSILIAAAKVSAELRVQREGFLQQVSTAIASRAREILGEQRIEALRFLSIMTAVGVSGPAADELTKLCSLLGDFKPNAILRELRSLSATGFLRITGNYVEVVPPLLANSLAESVAIGRAVDLVQVSAALDPPGVVRLMKRLRQLPSRAMNSFWEELSKSGPLASFEEALRNARLVREIAPAVRSRVANLLLAGFSAMSTEERKAIRADARREIVWTLDQLLFYLDSSSAALKTLALLAEAETESWSNNSTGIFAESFHPYHPQIPLSLHARLEVVRYVIARDPVSSCKELVLKAAEGAFSRYGAVTLRRSEAGDLLDPVPIIAYEELRSYLKSIIDLIAPMMKDTDRLIAERACEVVLNAVGEFTVHVDPNGGADILENLAEDALGRSLPIKLDTYVSTLKFSARGLSRPQDAPALSRIGRLLEQVEKGDVELQIRRWVGSWEYGDQAVDDEGHVIYEGELKIRKLAETVASDVGKIPHRLLKWLETSEAKRAYDFFFWLGRADSSGVWQSTVEAEGQYEEGELAFVGYFGGRSQKSPQTVNERLDQLTEDGKILGRAIVGATRYLPADERAVSRIIRIVIENRIKPQIAERILISGGWMHSLDSDQAELLLRALAGPKLQEGELVIDFLAMWTHSGKGIKGKLAALAWEALESTPASGEAWDFDRVAESLAPDDPDRSFDLLERYLTLPYDQKSWEPLDRHGGNRFWNQLILMDSKRAMCVLVRAAAASAMIAWRINWHVPDMLDLERDRVLLLEIADEGEEKAEFVSSCLEAKPGFWEVAIPLLTKHPHNKQIKRNVALAAEHINRVVTGPSSLHHAACAQEVIQAAKRQGLRPEVRAFLEELAKSLEARANADTIDEQDESVNW